MKCPMVSVYVCAYNQEKTIERCIESILAQTYSNKEIIIINDGSTDGTSELLKKYSRCCKVINKKNEGISLSRKKAISECNGSFVATVDADDYVGPKWLEIAMKIIIKTKSDVAMMGFESVNNNGNRLLFGLRKNYKYKVKSGIEVTKLLSRDILKNMCWGYIAAKSLCLDSLRLFDGISYYEDVAVTYNIMINAKKVVFIPGQYYFYVKNENSITKSPSIRQIKDLEKIRGEIEANLISKYPEIVKSWNFHILIMEYQIASLISNNKIKMNKLRLLILNNIPLKINFFEKIKIALIRTNIYSYVYKLLKKIR